MSFQGDGINNQATGMKDQKSEILKLTKAGNLQALARLLTILEREGPASLRQFPELLAPSRMAFRIGITGPPGAGKSTLIGKLIGEFRKQGKKVGVIAVDPSSPFSKGAVLGDRIRYSEHFGDPDVFIRSLGTRGSLGGLSASAYLMVRAFDLAGFDIVLLETVGVGQSELEIMNVADWVSVVLVPEAGDAIQGMKAGLLEIADLFVVNKGDRPGADQFLRELDSSLKLDPRGPSEATEIIKVTGLTGEGLEQIVSRAEAEMNKQEWRERRKLPERLQAEAQALLRHQVEREIEARTRVIQSPEDFLKVF